MHGDPFNWIKWLPLCRWGEGKSKQDEMEYKVWLLDDLLARRRAEQAVAVTEETSAAFVTVRQRQLQSTVTAGLMSYDAGLWRTRAAPSPAEIIWHNVQARPEPRCAALRSPQSGGAASLH